jgi:single-strand DNA-binding protein
MNLNKAFILGRLTADPEARALPSGQAISNFSLATNRVWKDKTGNRQESTDFHNIVLFGRLADVANQYLNKGKMCLVVGRIQNRSWEGKDGQKRYRTEIIGEELQLGPRMQSDSSSVSVGSAVQQKPAKKEDKKDLETEDEGEVDVEDIPF